MDRVDSQHPSGVPAALSRADDGKTPLFMYARCSDGVSLNLVGVHVCVCACVGACVHRLAFPPPPSPRGHPMRPTPPDNKPQTNAAFRNMFCAFSEVQGACMQQRVLLLILATLCVLLTLIRGWRALISWRLIVRLAWPHHTSPYTPSYPSPILPQHILPQHRRTGGQGSAARELLQRAAGFPAPARRPPPEGPCTRI